MWIGCTFSRLERESPSYWLSPSLPLEALSLKRGRAKLHCKIGELPIRTVLCCDTTSSNTGLYNGACTLLQQMMDKELLLSLAWRHHVLDFHYEAAFQECMGYSSDQEILLFKRFKAYLGLINVTQYMPGIKEQATVAIFSHKSRIFWILLKRNYWRVSQEMSMENF